MKLPPRPSGDRGAGGQVDGRGRPVISDSTTHRPPKQFLSLADGRPVAVVIGDVLVAHRRRALHQLRRPPAWAVDCSVLGTAERAGARAVLIIDLEAGTEFWASLVTIRRLGFRLDRGHGQQVALPLSWWRSTRREAERLAERLEAEQAQARLPGF